MHSLFYYANLRCIPIALLGGILLITTSQKAFCQAPTITRVSPATLQAGSKLQSVEVYGNNFGGHQDIWINCNGPENLPTYPSGDGTSFVVIVFTAAQLQDAHVYSLTAEACPNLGQPPAGANTLTVEAQQPFNDMAPLGEALVGVDVSAASSANPQAVLLALTNFDVPLESKFQLSQSHGGVIWLSGQLGLKGMAQPGTLSGAASAGYYASAANATPDKVVQSVDVSLHLGVQLHRWEIPMETFDVNASTGNSGGPSKTQATLSIVAGAGAVTPLSVSQSNPQVYEATPLIIQYESPVAPTLSFASSCSANPTEAPTCYVIFVPSDRTHFYRSYDAGLRLKLYANDNEDHELRFPAIFDLTVGQNEYVTGGLLHGAVLHLGGSLPIPRIDAFYMFGAFDFGLSSAIGGGPQLQLIPAPVTAGLTAASPSVYTILTTQPNRDRYELGFGIDVFHLFSKKLKSLM